MKLTPIPLRPALLCLALATLVAPSLHAQSSSATPFGGGYIHKFDTDIDGGGSISSDFIYARAAVPIFRDEGRFIGISGAYHLNAYDFSGGDATSLSALRPWKDVHTFRVGLPIRWKLGDKWSAFIAPSIRSVGENGASFDDSLSWGGITAFSYRFSDRLTIGPGIGYVSQIEDDPSIFPVIFLKWDITDTLSLSTGPSIGATLGPGLSLNWQVSDKVDFSVGARYEKLRFRLDEGSNSSPGGVGEDRGIPAFAGLTFQPGEHWRFSILGGVSFGNEVSLSDQGGNTIEERDFDPAPFAGINAAFSF